MSAARTLRQSASYPASARSPSTRWSPPARQRSAATFSSTTSAGRSTRMPATMSVHRPLRVPFSMPTRRPAAEMSWQGNPAVNTSTGAIPRQLMPRISPRLGTLGIRAVRICAMCGSESAHHAIRPPPSAASTPRSSPPYPVHTEPMTGPGLAVTDSVPGTVSSAVCGVAARSALAAVVVTATRAGAELFAGGCVVRRDWTLMPPCCLTRSGWWRVVLGLRGSVGNVGGLSRLPSPRFGAAECGTPARPRVR
ncbi:hypothetical protein KIPE111705_06805 [Kibdelosporangium persicum]